MVRASAVTWQNPIPLYGRLAELACSGAPSARLQEHFGGNWVVPRYSRRLNHPTSISVRDFGNSRKPQAKQTVTLWYTTKVFFLWEMQRAESRCVCLRMRVCVCVCVCVCVYVCMYACMYMCMCAFTGGSNNSSRATGAHGTRNSTARQTLGTYRTFRCEMSHVHTTKSMSRLNITN